MSAIITNSSHGPGRTCLAFSRDGSIAYTGGSDCIVRIWKTALGVSQEPEVASEAENAITSVSTANDCWLSGSADSEVRRYTKHKASLTGFVTNTPGLPVECVSIDPSGRKAAVTSQDLSVRLVELADTSKICLLAGHTKGVRRASWHPSGLILTTCGSDGKIIVWDVSRDEPKLEKTIEGIIPAVTDVQPDYVHDCSVVWHPSGHHFFAASRSHEIVSISRETWSKTSTLVDDAVSGVVTALSLSGSGAYLASATTHSSDVMVWSTSTGQLLFRQPRASTATITQLLFSPTQNLLAWTDTDGSFSRWSKPIPDSIPVSMKTLPSSGSVTVDPFLFEPDAIPEREGDDVGMAGLEDDWIIDDTDGEIVDDGDVGINGQDGFVKEMVSITKAQPPFQPGSTPMENKKRYLAYNMIGTIEVTDQDTHHIVNVEFHDQSTHKGYHFTDHFKYNLGCLGERGVVFASQPESEYPAQVLYKPYGVWSSHGEWTYQMRKDTKVIGVVASGVTPTPSRRRISDDLLGFGNVVIATSEGDLTFLSGTGRERRLMGLGAEYVSMVAGAEWVFVVHRAGSTTIDGSQNLSFSLFNYDDFSVRQSGLLPLAKGHALKWIGVTEEGAPATYDTAGLVHILTKVRIPMAATWARIMDTNLLERRAGKDESYWPIGIAGSTLMCLILKGRQQYPGFPKPLVQELPIRLPFRRDREDVTYEELIERELMLLEYKRDDPCDELMMDDITKRETVMDKEFIRLIQMACKKDNMPRAIEMAKLLHHTASFDMAVRVADFYHLVGLREQLQILKADREVDKSRHSLKHPFPPSIDSFTITDSSNDFAKHSAGFRPGPIRATPSVESTHCSTISNAAESASPPQIETISAGISSSPEGKRKRSEDAEPDDDSKRQELEHKSTRVNPFAKSKNPFVRRLEPNKTIQKSERFFEKVDGTGVDSAKKKVSSGKEREKIAATKQTTLLGLMFASTHDETHHEKNTIESETATPT